MSIPRHQFAIISTSLKISNALNLIYVTSLNSKSLKLKVKLKVMQNFDIENFRVLAYVG